MAQQHTAALDQALLNQVEMMCAQAKARRTVLPGELEGTPFDTDARPGDVAPPPAGDTTPESVIHEMCRQKHPPSAPPSHAPEPVAQ